MNYLDFIDSKVIRVQSSGIDVALKDINKKLFPFQRDVTRWAIKKGRAAVFLDTGLGKTFIQLEWARLIGERTLIIAPLSVARQTVREAKKLKIVVKYIRHQSEVDDGQIFITNYEMLDEFDPSQFGAVVLDESSILKSLDGKTRRKLIEMFHDTPYRLACTATPAPNDQSEIGNHADKNRLWSESMRDEPQNHEFRQQLAALTLTDQLVVLAWMVLRVISGKRRRRRWDVVEVYPVVYLLG